MITVTPSTDAAEAIHYARTSRTRAIEQLRTFVALPSVSAQRNSIARCGAWLTDHLRQIGLSDAALIQTAGNPIVLATWRHAPSRPTLLIYGHYDVQPPEPLSAWTSPPFKASLRDGYIYGRGASDDKGQLFSHVKAIDAWLAACARLPCNIICLFEGEEEIGSPHLAAFLHEHRARLRADAAVVSDTSMRSPNHPAITYSLRGLATFKLHVRTAPAELHSGAFGGAVPDAAIELSRILASLQDPHGQITIPGFYDDVQTITRRQRALMAVHGPTDTELLRTAGLTSASGESGYSTYERTTIRPSLTVNAITAGHQRARTKAVIPATATATLSLRLVPHQHPDRIEPLLRDHVAGVAPPAVQANITAGPSSPPVDMPPEHPAIAAAASACRRVFGRDPALLRSGGTIKPISDLQHTLQLPVIALGFGLHADHWHAPNERFPIHRYAHAIDTAITFLDEFGHRAKHAKPRRPPISNHQHPSTANPNSEVQHHEHKQNRPGNA